MEKTRSTSPLRYRMKHDLVQKPYKKTVASKFPEFIDQVKIECLYIKTLKSAGDVFVDPESSQIYCPMCKLYINSQTEGKTHLTETHPEGFSLIESSAFPGTNQLFYVTGEISRNTLTTSVNLRNMTSVLNVAAESLSVKQVFVAGTEILMVNRTAITVEDLGSLTLKIPRMSLAEPVNLVIQCTGSREYFEQHRIWVAESLPFIINKARFCLNSDGRGRSNRQTRKLQTRLNYQPLTMLFAFINKENFQLKSSLTDVPPYASVTMAGEVVTTEMMHRIFLRFRTARTVDAQHYILTFLILNAIEDLYATTQLEQFKLKQTCRRIERREQPTYKIDVYREENFPHLLKEGDLITVNSIVEGDAVGIKVDCTIVKIENGEIWFVPNDLKNFNNFGPEEFVFTFRKNRFGFMIEQHCIETFSPSVIEFCLFPKIEQIPAVQLIERPHWFNPAISSNPEQQQAVESILSGTAGSAPYILFGPPGTGKTATLVEAICQILHQNLETTILVTASSNFACDEISARLIRYVHRKDIYRYYSKASQAKDIDSETSVDSNSIPGYNTPDFSFIKTYRVVIATLTMAGRLSIDQLPKGFFEYIFIDECGSVTEPNAIIPLSLLVALNNLTHMGQPVAKPTKIVIAGDPKQLGPIVNCKIVDIPGLGKSLMERLMDLELYKPDATGKYNAAVITKLLQNYRSHPEILHIPNKLFYDGQLQATADSRIINFALGWSFLPNPNFPIIFYPIQGYAQTDSITSSICNAAEIDVVFNYVTEITRNGINGIQIPKSEIGVVTPYRKQAIRIRRKLANNLMTDIEVGSVEQFQGQEKMVIILSTVRSNTDTIGFLSNPRRLNVVLTRAKGLLIIVGNPNTLSQDENWNHLLRHCEKNYAYHIESSQIDKANAIIDTQHDLRLKLQRHKNYNSI